MTNSHPPDKPEIHDCGNTVGYQLYFRLPEPSTLSAWPAPCMHTATRSRWRGALHIRSADWPRRTTHSAMRSADPQWRGYVGGADRNAMSIPIRTISWCRRWPRVQRIVRDVREQRSSRCSATRRRWNFEVRWPFLCLGWPVDGWCGQHCLVMLRVR